jgi:hypothetical protein
VARNKGEKGEAEAAGAAGVDRGTFRKDATLTSWIDTEKFMDLEL